MTEDSEIERLYTDCAQLPANYPTHKHSAEFWEALGRAVATFGFLEWVLGRAIFALTATRKIPADQFEVEYEKWLPTLEKALTDPLGSLIREYERAVQANDEANIPDDLLKQLRKAAMLRNVICHGTWQSPDDKGRSVPLYMDKKRNCFATPIGVAYLAQLRQAVVEFSCDVINSVTQMGYQFPGSEGPGKSIR